MSCKHEYVRVNPINEKFCKKCTMCLDCLKNPATIDPEYGVMPCKECTQKQRGLATGSRWKSDRKLREYAATPFWRHMGLDAKPHELQQEKKMKWEGKTYGDLQMERNSGKNARFDNSKLIKNILDGKAPKSMGTRYGREQ